MLLPVVRCFLLFSKFLLLHNVFTPVWMKLVHVDFDFACYDLAQYIHSQLFSPVTMYVLTLFTRHSPDLPCFHLLYDVFDLMQYFQLLQYMVVPDLWGIRLLHHDFAWCMMFFTWNHAFTCYTIWSCLIFEVFACCTMFLPVVRCFSPETMFSPVTLYGLTWFMRYSPSLPCLPCCDFFDVPPALRFHLLFDAFTCWPIFCLFYYVSSWMLSLSRRDVQQQLAHCLQCVYLYFDVFTWLAM